MPLPVTQYRVHIIFDIPGGLGWFIHIYAYIVIYSARICNKTRGEVI